MTLRAPLAALVLATTLATAACTGETPSATSPAPSGTTGATIAAVDPPAAGDRDACLAGKWSADVDAMAENVSKMGGMTNATGSGTGNLTLEFGDQMTITYDDVVFSLTMEISGSKAVGKNTVNGSATSTEYHAKDGKITGVMPGGKISTKTVVVLNGVETPTTTGGYDGNLDLSKGTLAYTCSGDTATLNNGFFAMPLKKIS
ncbi:hypothetical protein [Catellatospora sp. IY07-71]|uniref:hypothetical protein n=1 Tax=Catellatospora sp. IY07-71 TaxID=2728827 RepID=UPI001BB41C25|nr:hypothetical protein [Catellatospora sp. IY07-71]